MTIQGAGNVGIGTTTPQARLNVRNDSASEQMRLTNLTVNSDPYVLIQNDATYWTAGVFGGDSDSFKIRNGSDVSVITATTGGNVGIGTTSPLFKLHVAEPTDNATYERGILSSLNSDNGRAPVLALQKGRGTLSAPTAVQNGDSLGMIYMRGHDGTQYRASGGISFMVDGPVATNQIPSAIVFRTSTTWGDGSEVMRIRSNGNVGIGTTNPTYQLQLSTDSAAKPGTSTWTIASDERLKDIRAPFTRGLEEILGLNTIYFKYKSQNQLGLPSNKEYVGIRAQDVQKVIPEAVSVDEKGYYHVTNDSIIWTAVNAIKELYRKVLGHEQQILELNRQTASLADSKADKDATQAELQKLKTENALLKARLEKIEQALKAK